VSFSFYHKPEQTVFVSTRQMDILPGLHLPLLEVLAAVNRPQYHFLQAKQKQNAIKRTEESEPSICSAFREKLCFPVSRAVLPDTLLPSYRSRAYTSTSSFHFRGNHKTSDTHTWTPGLSSFTWVL